MSQAVTPALTRAFQDLPRDMEGGVYIFARTPDKLFVHIATRTLQQGAMRTDYAAAERSVSVHVPTKFHSIDSLPSLDLAKFEHLNPAKRCPWAFKMMEAIKDLAPFSLKCDITCVARCGFREQSLRYEDDQKAPRLCVGDAIPDDLNDLIPLAQSSIALEKLLAKAQEADPGPKAKTPQTMPVIEEAYAETVDA